jgi:hypothetical protein
MIKTEKGKINKDDARNIYLEQENEEEINENNKGEKEKNILYYNKEFNKVKTNKILKKIKGKKKYLIKFNKAQNTKKISTQGLNDISQNASSINSKSLLAKGNSSKSLFNLTVEGYFLEVRVVLHTLQAVGGVLLVLGGDVTGHTGNTASLLLCALQDDLHPVSFLFLCHSS